MPEVLAIVFVLLVSGGVYLAVWWQVKTTPLDPAAELRRLAQHLSWLEERQRQAERLNWDDDMRRNLAAQVEGVRRDQAKFEAQLAAAGPAGRI